MISEEPELTPEWVEAWKKEVERVKHLNPLFVGYNRQTENSYEAGAAIWHEKDEKNTCVTLVPLYSGESKVIAQKLRKDMTSIFRSFEEIAALLYKK